MSFREMLRVIYRVSAVVNKVKEKAELRRARSRDAGVLAGEFHELQKADNSKQSQQILNVRWLKRHKRFVCL